MFVRYGSGTIDGLPVDHGVYTHIKGECSVSRDGELLTISSVDGTETEIYQVSDDGSSPLIKRTTTGKPGNENLLAEISPLMSEIQYLLRETSGTIDKYLWAETFVSN
jgi:hypothetical protein